MPLALNLNTLEREAGGSEFQIGEACVVKPCLRARGIIIKGCGGPRWSLKLPEVVWM